ncbi:MAG: mutator mutT protein domain [Herbinix sp.]|jgi:8-oxo-dGTP diphosphatase|nr:mutator mutT protein domain [Herbinix sp.]
MKNVEVVAAIIIKGDQILATKRGYGDFINLWEFPGGKIENDETKEEALIREIKEELKVTISIDSFLCTVNYDYPNFHLVMHCFICSITSGELTLVEHKDAKWLTHDTLDSVQWLPADIQILSSIKTYIQR